MVTNIQSSQEIINLLSERHSMYGGFIFYISPVSNTIDYEEIYSKESYTVNDWLIYKKKQKEEYGIPYMTALTYDGCYTIAECIKEFSEYLQKLK